MNELTFVFDRFLVERQPHENTGKRIETTEERINDFLLDVKTIRVGYGVIIHLDLLYERFKACLDINDGWISLEVHHAIYEDGVENHLRAISAFNVIIRAGDTLRLEKVNDLATIKLTREEEA